MNLITPSEDVKSGAALTKDEARLLQLYRRLSITKKEHMLCFAEVYATSTKVAKPAPAKASLHLIKGGMA